ncbi:MAG: hypothetical protein KBC64_07345 [Simkaniaceae bacterium]|nr:hypothetical protein [Simkaniaceae bacterium]
MRKILVILFLVFTTAIATEPPRFCLSREEGNSPIVYYLSAPQVESYPILVICDGSGKRSGLFMRECLTSWLEPLQVGVLTVEKWGIDGSEIDEEEFWNHYTRSQRLHDHAEVIHYLENDPPKGWDGRLIFIGASEGGPLVMDLSIMFKTTLATMNWAGAGDWPWQDELWEFFEHWKSHSLWMRIYAALPRWLPFTLDMPSSRDQYDELVQHILENPTRAERLAGMTYLYHADAFQQQSIDYSKIHASLLVVTGTEDPNITSSDQFVLKAEEAGAEVTYMRVQGMDHYIRHRPDIIEASFAWLKDRIESPRAI